MTNTIEQKQPEQNGPIHIRLTQRRIVLKKKASSFYGYTCKADCRSREEGAIK